MHQMIQNIMSKESKEALGLLNDEVKDPAQLDLLDLIEICEREQRESAPNKKINQSINQS